MFLVVGLGNPGKKYEDTRHNIGVEVIDRLESLDLKEIVLTKPQTFMNNSGKLVKKLVENPKLEIRNLVIIHDDIDLPVGKIRIVKNRGAAGHKGVESVIKELGTKNFIRIRIGIKPKFGKPKNPEKFVLQKFNKEERETIKEATKNAAEAVELFLEKGLEKAMSEFNK